MPEVQARQLIEIAEAAPYGRGTETVLDHDHRRTWQIDASQFSLHGDAWRRDLDNIVHRAVRGLGVKGKVEAQPYKLLIYDEGCFFLPHRDSEKTAGMFATLVIVLPSAYQGGELVVEHQGKRMVLDLRQDDPAEVSYAAFYADCRHEVKPVTTGHRLALVFNLARPKSIRLPKPPQHEPAIAHLAEALDVWNGDGDWLIYPLEHAYTEAGLGFANLKARDRARAEVLAEAAKRADCELYDPVHRRGERLGRIRGLERLRNRRGDRVNGGAADLADARWPEAALPSSTLRAGRPLPTRSLGHHRGTGAGFNRGHRQRRGQF